MLESFQPVRYLFWMEDKALSETKGDPRLTLSGQVALITGGAGLLGQRHAEALLEIGATVVITDLDEERLNDAKRKLEAIFDGRSHVVTSQMDVTDEASILATQAALKSKDLNVSVLINNAAVNPSANKVVADKESTRVSALPLAQWNLELSVGLTGAFLCSRIFGSAMVGRAPGVILNIASDLSVIAPDQRLYKINAEQNPEKQPVKPITYSVIKTGLLGMTRYLAAYWGDAGIRVNALSPGGVYDNQDEEFVRRLTNLIPMGRMAESDEYKGAVQFLCSPASSYMTGQNIVIDGGRTIL